MTERGELENRVLYALGQGSEASFDSLVTWIEERYVRRPRVIETTPAPFPPALETAITEALMKHREELDQTAWSEYECSCGFKPGPVETELWRGQEIGIVDEDWFAAHIAAVVMEVNAQHMTAEALAETRPGLALANTAFGEGLSAGIRACNEAEDGQPFVRPVSPYSAPLLAIIRQEVKGDG